jgi:hypothetical protein
VHTHTYYILEVSLFFNWDSLLEEVVSFYKKFENDIPDFGACYVQR